LPMFLLHERPIAGKTNPIEGQAIIAELIGSNTCTAAGVTVVDHVPVLALCRALVKAGQDSNRPLHAYRGHVLCLSVRSRGEGARLTVEDDRYGRPRLRRWEIGREGMARPRWLAKSETPLSPPLHP